MNIRAKKLEVYVTKNWTHHTGETDYKIQYRLPNQFFLRTLKRFCIGYHGARYNIPIVFEYVDALKYANKMTIESIQQMERQYAEDKQAKIAAYKKPTNRERIK